MRYIITHLCLSCGDLNRFDFSPRHSWLPTKRFSVCVLSVVFVISICFACYILPFRWLFFTVKTKSPFWGMLYLFWVWIQNGVGTYIVFFLFRWTYVQPHHWKALAETFWMMWLIIGLSWKITKLRTTPVLISHSTQVYSIPQNVFFLIFTGFLSM